MYRIRITVPARMMRKSSTDLAPSSIESLCFCSQVFLIIPLYPKCICRASVVRLTALCVQLCFFFLYSSFTVFSMLTLQRSEKSRHLPAECFVDGQNCCRKSCVCCIGSCEHPLWPCCCRISLTFCIFIFIWGATRDSTWPYAFYHVSA